MFGLDLLPVEAIGVISAFVAGLLAMIPALGASDARRALTAVAVLIVAVLAQSGFDFVSWQAFAQAFVSAAVYAVVSYKLVLQPLVLPGVARGLAGLRAPRG